MTPWIYGVGAAALIGSLAGWTVRDWKADSDELALERKADAIQEKRSAEAFEAARTVLDLTRQIREARQTNTNTIREIYRDVEVPSQCAVPDAAVGVLTQSVRRANAAAAGGAGGSLPGAERATASDGGGSDDPVD